MWIVMTKVPPCRIEVGHVPQRCEHDHALHICSGLHISNHSS